MKAMKINKAQLTSLLLRLGLATVFTYAAISTLRQPDTWIGYLPTFIEKMRSAIDIVRFFAVVEILLSVWLLSGKYVRYAALLSASMLLGIVFSQPSQLITTFRDIGLMFMALALAVNDW